MTTSRRLALLPLLLPGLLALFALYLLIPWSTASAQQASREDTCPGADSAPTPTLVEVGAVPIVVESTTDEYFVLYVWHDLDADTTFQVPVGVTLGQDGATTLTESLEALPKERYRVEKYLVSDPADVDGDCTDDIAELADPVGMNPVNPVPAMSFDDGAAAIPNRETYVSLAYKGEIGAIDRHLAGWEAVKFHMVDMNTDRPSVYFMNTKTYQRHDDFQAAVGLEVDPLHGHETMVGEMVYHPKAVAPDGSLGVYRFQFGANGVYSFKEISYAFTVLAASMPLLEDNLAYYPMWSKAVPRYHKDKSLYDDSRVNVLLAEDIAFDLDFISLNRGRGFGFLRAMSLGERPNPRDIVIYDTLPNELPRVAGIITTVPQTPLSHVNLRAVQDGVPNAFVRDALEAPDAGTHPVHLPGPMSGGAGACPRFQVYLEVLLGEAPAVRSGALWLSMCGQRRQRTGVYPHRRRPHPPRCGRGGMLGKQSDQRGLWEADRLYIDHVGRGSFYGLLASLRRQLFRDEEFGARRPGPPWEYIRSNSGERRFSAS